VQSFVAQILVNANLSFGVDGGNVPTEAFRRGTVGRVYGRLSAARSVYKREATALDSNALTNGGSRTMRRGE
jgi:hypothetical protein